MESLGGRYITVEDMNTSEQTWDISARNAMGYRDIPAHGGNGDPSPATAWGVYHGLRACLNHCFWNTDPRGRKVAIQGVGSVGYYLSKYLSEAGAELFYSDINQTFKRLCLIGGKVIENNDFILPNVNIGPLCNWCDNQ